MWREKELCGLVLRERKLWREMEYIYVTFFEADVCKSYFLFYHRSTRGVARILEIGVLVRRERIFGGGVLST